MSVFGQRRRVLEQFADDRCGGKIPCDSEYSARLLAQGAINRRSDRLRPRVAKLYVYHCPNCDRWHMTSSPPRPGHPQRAPVTATSLGMENPTP